jgi:hypothetical protein
MSKRAMLNAEGQHLSLKHRVKNTKAKPLRAASTAYNHRTLTAVFLCLWLMLSQQRNEHQASFFFPQ